MMVDPSVDMIEKFDVMIPIYTALVTVQSNTTQTSRQCIVTTVTQQNPRLRTVARFNKPLTRL